MEDSLHDFIHKAAAQGESAEQIKQSLLAVGWDETAVTNALHDIFSVQQLNRTLPAATAPSPTTIQPKQVYRSPKNSPAPHFSTAHFLLSLVAFFIIGGSAIGGVYYYYKARPSSQNVAQNNSKNSQQTGQTDTLKSVPTAIPHGLAYANTQYKFSVTVPENWSIKEFPDEDYAPEKRFAFGPSTELPEEFFSNEEYVWLRIYPVSEQNLYDDYLFLQSLVGKDFHATPATLGGKTGFRYNEFLATEYNNFVYELHLLLQSQEQSTSEFTLESQQILQSFTFTQ